MDDGPGDPDVLLAKYREATSEAALIREKLKAVLADALKGG